MRHDGVHEQLDFLFEPIDGFESGGGRLCLCHCAFCGLSLFCAVRPRLSAVTIAVIAACTSSSVSVRSGDWNVRRNDRLTLPSGMPLPWYRSNSRTWIERVGSGRPNGATNRFGRQGIRDENRDVAHDERVPRQRGRAQRLDRRRGASPRRGRSRRRRPRPRPADRALRRSPATSWPKTPIARPLIRMCARRGRGRGYVRSASVNVSVTEASAASCSTTPLMSEKSTGRRAPLQ